MNAPEMPQGDVAAIGASLTADSDVSIDRSCGDVKVDGRVVARFGRLCEEAESFADELWTYVNDLQFERAMPALRRWIEDQA